MKQYFLTFADFISFKLCHYNNGIIVRFCISEFCKSFFISFFGLLPSF